MRTEIELLKNEFIDRLLEVDPSGNLLVSLYNILDTQHREYLAFLHELRKIKKINKYSEQFLKGSKESHKMKSSYGNMGLSRLQSAAVVLERVLLQLSKTKDNIEEELNLLTVFTDEIILIDEIEKQSFQILKSKINNLNKVA